MLFLYILAVSNRTQTHLQVVQTLQLEVKEVVQVDLGTAAIVEQRLSPRLVVDAANAKGRVADGVVEHGLGVLVQHLDGAHHKPRPLTLRHAERILARAEAGRVVVDVDDLDVHVDAVLVGRVLAVAVGAVLGDHRQRDVLLVADRVLEPDGARVGVDLEVVVLVGAAVELVGDLVEGGGDVQVVGFGHGDHLVQVA